MICALAALCCTIKREHRAVPITRFPSNETFLFMSKSRIFAHNDSYITVIKASASPF